MEQTYVRPPKLENYTIYINHVCQVDTMRNLKPQNRGRLDHMAELLGLVGSSEADRRH